MYAARVLSPQIWHCSTCFSTTGRLVCFLRISRELWVGVNRSVAVKSLNRVNKPWVNKEAWYSFFAFSTQNFFDSFAEFLSNALKYFKQQCFFCANMNTLPFYFVNITSLENISELDVFNLAISLKSQIWKRIFEFIREIIIMTLGRLG